MSVKRSRITRSSVAGTTAICIIGLAGCGSTVRLGVQGQIAGNGSDLSGLSAGSNNGANGPAVVNPTQGSTAPGMMPGSDAPVSNGSIDPTTGLPGANGAGQTSASAIPAMGKGWDKSTVYIGMTTAKDAETALRTLGISLNPGDQAGDAAAIEKAVNASGGLFGRKIKIVVHDNKSTSIAANASSVAQSNCTYFAQDRPVIAVINTVSLIDLDEFRACLAKAHIPLVTLSTQPFDDTTVRAYAPYYYNPISVSWSRLANVLINRLSEVKFFTGWNTVTGAASATARVKVGVLYGGDKGGTRAAALLLGALKKAGYATDSFQYSDATNQQPAVLRFEQNGVTHVLSVDNALTFFMTSANNQNYRPRYGVNTYNGINVLLERTAPASQLVGALGVGWYSSLDVNQDQGPVGPGQKKCLSDLAADGQTFAGKRFAQAVGLAICDGIHLTVMGAQQGGGLDPVAVRRGVVRLGSTFPVAGGFSSGLSDTNFGLPGSGRDLAYTASCTCFLYSSSTYPL